MISITYFFSRLVAVMARSRGHAATRNMLQLDDHMLWDIGLTRGDVVDCLSSPAVEPADFLHRRQVRNLRSVAGDVRFQRTERRLAA